MLTNIKTALLISTNVTPFTNVNAMASGVVDFASGTVTNVAELHLATGAGYLIGSTPLLTIRDGNGVDAIRIAQASRSLYGTNNAAVVGWGEGYLAGNGAGLTNIQPTNIVNDSAQYVTLYSTNMTPVETELITKQWMLTKINSGAFYYNTTNIQTNGYSPAGFNYSNDCPAQFARGYLIASNNQYLGATFTPNPITNPVGPVIANIYMSVSNITPSQSVVVRPEWYLTADRTNTYYEAEDAASITLTTGNGTNPYPVIWPHPAFTTNVYGMRRIKVINKGAGANPYVYIHGGSNTPSTLTLPATGVVPITFTNGTTNAWFSGALAVGTNDSATAKLLLQGEAGALTNKPMLRINRTATATGNMLEAGTTGLTAFAVSTAGVLTNAGMVANGAVKIATNLDMNGASITNMGPNDGYVLPYVLTQTDTTMTITRSMGNLVSLVTTGTCTVTPSNDWLTNGVGMIALSVYPSNNTFTVTNAWTSFATMPTISTNSWNTLIYLKPMGTTNWAGRQ